MAMNPVGNVSITDQTPHLATSEIIFSRILVGTDFSKAANQALKTAIILCQLFGAKLSLVHACAPIPYLSRLGRRPMQTSRRRQKKCSSLFRANPDLAL